VRDEISPAAGFLQILAWVLDLQRPVRRIALERTAQLYVTTRPTWSGRCTEQVQWRELLPDVQGILSIRSHGEKCILEARE